VGKKGEKRIVRLLKIAEKENTEMGDREVVEGRGRRKSRTKGGSALNNMANIPEIIRCRGI